jgi:hypothetical protein
MHLKAKQGYNYTKERLFNLHRLSHDEIFHSPDFKPPENTRTYTAVAPMKSGHGSAVNGPSLMALDIGDPFWDKSERTQSIISPLGTNLSPTLGQVLEYPYWPTILHWTVLTVLYWNIPAVVLTV